jgi:tetratricopeptide (TPR) repeat protein
MTPEAGFAAARRLEALWEQGLQPDLGQFLSGLGGPASLEPFDLSVVVRVDQRWRWRAGQRVPAGAYLLAFPDLGRDDEAVLAVVYSEFTGRREMGEALSKEAFLRSQAELLRDFPHLTGQLADQIDFREALETTATGQAAPLPSGPGSLLEMLGQSGILEETLAGLLGGLPEVDQQICRLRLDGYALRDLDASAQQQAPRDLPLPTVPPDDELPRKSPTDGDFPALPGYESLDRLGKGGMGVVYKARDARLGRLVALKFLPAEYAQDPRRLGRFRREALTASALNHPHICTIHDAGEHGGQPYIVMELVEGRTLRALAGQGLPVERLALLFGQVARALGAAHAAGVVHRDIKPENLMVRDDGYVKVLDFGLARRLPTGLGGEATGPGTDPGTVLGTPHYMSPEQARSEALEGASDIFSLGIVLYELATGRHPFAADTWPAVLNAIISQPAVSAVRLRPDLPAALDDLLRQMLHKDSRRRPSAAEVAAALDRLTRYQSETRGTALPVAGAVQRHTVGRRRERQVLQAALASAVAGRGLFVCVTGEPGIGKTTLVEDFLAELVVGQECRIARGRCSERLAGTEAYLPFLEALESLVRGPGGDAVVRLLKAVAPTWYVQLAPADDPALARLADQAQASSQERLKRELVAFLQEMAGLRPLVAFFDDLHWADASTVDLLAYVGGKCEALRLLVVLTYRPSEMLLRQHPFLPVQLELQGRSRCREVALGFLNRSDIERYLGLEFPGHRCPEKLVDLILGKTEGNPLFMADLLRYLHDRGAIAEVQGHWELTRPLEDLEGELPESVRSMIQRKIDQLSEQDRRLLMAASVQGSEFDSAVVARVLGLEAADVEERLEVLERMHALVRCQRKQEFPDRTLTVRYAFIHVLYQNALSAAVQPTRRASWSAATAQALLGLYGARSGEVAVELAFLFETARDSRRAGEQFFQAARNAVEVFAYHEARTLARRGLEQLRSLPETPERDRQELLLQIILGGALQVTKGYAVEETGQAYQRAQQLCQRLGEVPGSFRALGGLWFFHVARLDLRTARQLGEELLRLAQRKQDPVQLLQAHWALGMTTGHQGEYTLALEYLRAAMPLFDPAQHCAPGCLYGPEPGTACHAFAAWVLWPLGYPDQALECIRQAVARAREVSDPQSLCLALIHAVYVHQRRGEVRPTRERAEELTALGAEYGFPAWVMLGTVLGGWAQVAEGECGEGFAHMRRGLRELQAQGPGFGRLQCLALLAVALAKQGEAAEAQTVLDEGLALLKDTGDWFYESDLYRIQGELLAPQGAGPDALAEAECWFRRAVEVARRREAKSLELRAVLNLTRLYQKQGRGEEMRPLLAETYAWFTEGFDTADLREAATLLQQLS